MKEIESKKLVYQFAFSGLSLGILFLVVILLVDLHSKGLGISLSGILNLHRITPIFWFIDLTPFFLSTVGYWIGFKITSDSIAYAKSVENEQTKSKSVSTFLEKLRDGDINAEYTISDEADELGKALIALRDKLVSNQREESYRKREDSQRHWVTEGLAMFGVILRMNNDNLELLSANVIQHLVKYLNIEQAGFFIISEEDSEKYFDLIACFAYDRKKFANKRLAWGEGLVGACALEKQTIYMTNVTDGYVEITSGLGKSNPRAICIVPLKINEEVHGVLELASFRVFESYEIEFVEKVAESIASTISSVKINLRTSQLLKESQEGAQKMADTEKIMKLNMEELRSTQKEAAKQAEEFISFTNSVNHTLIRAEYDTKGILLYANTKFLQKLEYTEASEVIGHHISMFINEKDKVWFNKIWEGLANGGRHFEGDMKHVTKFGNDLWTMATYVCVRNNEGGVEKILFLGTDITENKKQSLDYEGQINALNRSSLKADIYPDGKLIECNDKFLTAMGYKANEVKYKKVFNFIHDDEINNFHLIWENVVNRIPFDGRLKSITKDGAEKWFHGTYTAVDNMYGEVAKIVYIAHEITDQIRIEQKIKAQTEQLKMQEKKLQQSQVDLSQKLKEAREEMQLQFKNIEVMKTLNENTLEGALDAIVTINQNGNIEFFNRAAEELWKLSKDQVIGKHLITILPEEFNGKDDNYMGNFFCFSENPILRTRFEVFILDAEKNTIPVLITLSEAKVESNYTLTAFIQNIEVELF